MIMMPPNAKDTIEMFELIKANGELIGRIAFLENEITFLKRTIDSILELKKGEKQ